ncbi:hypothetical protein [Oligella urethralis]|uniref:DUF2190 domain-containing protein n=1 Tax=Oligella urethralis TaxID=90245 RepID=A0A2X1UWE1_9BURK|nr:hypothetical protein [Oligella urethralis]SPY08033.1 Uncharacterised protein [Oligella urethralis]
MAKFKVGPLVQEVAETFRVGTKAAPLVDADKGKLVTVGSEGSQVVLGEADGEIFGFLTSVEPSTQDGYKIGGVITKGYALVDTGDVAVGEYVVIDSNPASGTAGKTKVKKATGTPKYLWQVVDTGVIRKV